MAHAKKKARTALPFPELPTLRAATSGVDGSDCTLLISSFAKPLGADPVLKRVQAAVEKCKALDATSGSECNLYAADVPGGRLVISPTGSLKSDYDDVRSFGEAAEKGLRRAVKAGAKDVLVIVDTGIACAAQRVAAFKRIYEVAALGLLSACYYPIECREDASFSAAVPTQLTLFMSEAEGKAILGPTAAIELGRAVARDIGGSDPERMTSLRTAEYLTGLFKGTPVTVRIDADLDHLKAEYPLLHAVARCSNVIERHRPVVVHLEYKPSGEIKKTLFLVGKGITYDTGGADIKAGGVMAGMHRDKCGAAAVAGFFKVLAELKPEGVRVVGKLAMVRNSVGADAYVADEIIRSRAGCRVRVGNTDAEGRMAMCDLLCEAKEEAATAVAPALFTIATLTGHVVRAFGEGYSSVLPNGLAEVQGIHKKLYETGAEWGDPFEYSSVRREDFAFIRTPYPTEDVLQANSKPSTMTARGHQYPAAFLTVASGMDKHSLSSEAPLAYTHMDIAGSTHSWPRPVTGAPIPALYNAFCT